MLTRPDSQQTTTIPYDKAYKAWHNILNNMLQVTMLLSEEGTATNPDDIPDVVGCIEESWHSIYGGHVPLWTDYFDLGATPEHPSAETSHPTIAEIETRYKAHIADFTRAFKDSRVFDIKAYFVLCNDFLQSVFRLDPALGFIYGDEHVTGPEATTQLFRYMFAEYKSSPHTQKRMLPAEYPRGTAAPALATESLEEAPTTPAAVKSTIPVTPSTPEGSTPTAVAEDACCSCCSCWAMIFGPRSSRQVSPTSSEARELPL